EGETRPYEARAHVPGRRPGQRHLSRGSRRPRRDRRPVPPGRRRGSEDRGDGQDARDARQRSDRQGRFWRDVGGPELQRAAGALSLFYSITRVWPDERPKVSGLYISSALAGGATHRPGRAARRGEEDRT